MRALLAALLLSLSFSLSVPSAHADPLPAGLTASVNVNLMTVTAYPGRSNNVVISRDATGWWVSESGPLAVSAGPGCAHVSGYPTTTVRCQLGVTNVRVNLGDWDDELTVTANVTTDVNGGDGNDVINGGPGQDFIDGGFGADVLRGGVGLDTVSYQSRTSSVRASIDGVANDAGQSGERDTIATDVENLWGGAGWDTLYGSDQRNFLYGLGGWDTLYGRGGNDHIDGGDGNDTMDGGLGADTLYGANDTDTADYGSRTVGVAVYLDGVANDGESGEADNVSLNTENVTGGSGDDVLAGSSARNVLRGGPGADGLVGHDGDDSLLGEDGDDLIFGGDGNDWLPGDRAGGPIGRDYVDGGNGVDSTTYEGRTIGVFVILDGDANDGQYGEGDRLLAIETVTGGNGADALVGGPGGETLSGGNGADYIDGAGGADVLRGGPGDDTIYGLDGDDTLDGGTGVDDLDGEAGSDRCEAADGGGRASCELLL